MANHRRSRRYNGSRKYHKNNKFNKSKFSKRKMSKQERERQAMETQHLIMKSREARRKLWEMVHDPSRMPGMRPPSPPPSPTAGMYPLRPGERI